MKRLDQNRQDAFARALQYNTDHALTPAVPRATALFTELGGIKTGMLADAATQATGFTVSAAESMDARKRSPCCTTKCGC